ncbi:hypothetical protein OE88DRAFT_1811286 [Heliocybe sulcata]|uniref:Uncharacterized protein n=1 Tax=Heliocybe sulcata TaxID=5364 RepID=A0A5C3MQ72_9AGAM|nr:hypothetical protein OE88DRAFT_1811286 [Heliocybe sulcata]
MAPATPSKKDKITKLKQTVKDSLKARTGVQLVAPLKRWQRHKTKMPFARYTDAREESSLDRLATSIMVKQLVLTEHCIQHSIYMQENGAIYCKREGTPLPKDDEEWAWVPDEDDLVVQPPSTAITVLKIRDKNTVPFPCAESA